MKFIILAYHKCSFDMWNIWFLECKRSNYRGKLRCHACDGGRMDGQKVENSAVLVEQKPQLEEMSHLPILGPFVHIFDQRRPKLHVS